VLHDFEQNWRYFLLILFGMLKSNQNISILLILFYINSVQLKVLQLVSILEKDHEYDQFVSHLSMQILVFCFLLSYSNMFYKY
jgi:hypothetical protein